MVLFMAPGPPESRSRTRIGSSNTPSARDALQCRLRKVQQGFQCAGFSEADPGGQHEVVDIVRDPAGAGASGGPFAIAPVVGGDGADGG